MRLHKGLDLRAPIGTPVLAVVDAIVILMTEEKEGGKVLGLASRCRDGTFPEKPGWFHSEGSAGHDDSGWRIYYAHLSSYAPGIEVGTTVRKGALIAYSGNSGTPPGGGQYPPHLHVVTEWLEDGWVDSRVFVDPRFLLPIPTYTGASMRSGQGVYFVPAIIQPRGASADEMARGQVMVNVQGGTANVNLGRGVAVQAGTVQQEIGLIP